MNTVELNPFEICFRPNNARKVFTGIKGLADSIDKHGLLTDPLVEKVAGKWTLVAGERRVRACRMLIEQGRTGCFHTINADENEFVITCKVYEGAPSEASWASMTENVQREDVPIWQIGATLLDYIEAGLNQKEIAPAICKSQGYVSIATKIARGLHPKIVDKLNERLPEQYNQAVLTKLSEMMDYDTGTPDLERQKKYLEHVEETKHLWKRNKKTTATRKVALYRRFERFRTLTPPQHAEPFARAVIDYLMGVGKKVHWPED